MPNGYTITTVYDLQRDLNRDRFDAFRKARNMKPYFCDERVGASLPATTFLADVADLDDLDKAFLTGAELATCNGIRVPWGTTTKFADQEPRFQMLKEQEWECTVWPSSHALIAIDHELLAFLVEFVHGLESH